MLSKVESSDKNELAEEKLPPLPFPLPTNAAAQETPRNLRFWLVILSLCITCFLSALDLTAVSTALPTIAKDLEIEEFAWIGSSYALSSTVFLPFSAALSYVFGRRPILIIAICLFAIGSALSGAANGLGLMVAGRTIAGVGGGGILGLSELLVSDLVPLSKRGLFMGIFGSVWAISSAIGPPIGGAFSASQWRWLFFMNIPLAGLSLTLVFFFLTFKIPTMSFTEKMRRIDWLGNLIFVISVTCIILGLTFGGGQFEWQSAAVLVPLIVGCVGLILFFLYEIYCAKEPTVPVDLLNNKTVVIGYLTTFLHGLIVMLVVYYLPIYFQAVRLQSPIKSGISLFSLSFSIAPAAILTGAIITISKKYKPVSLVGWLIATVGLALMTLIKPTSSPAVWIITPLIAGIGLGFGYTFTAFLVQSPIAVELATHALGFHAFSRSFGQAIGVTVGATILQNLLKRNLPQSFLSMIGNPKDIAFVGLPRVSSLDAPSQQLVKAGYTTSLRYIWVAGAVFAGIALLMTIFVKEYAMHDVTDKRFEFQQKQERSSRSSDAPSSADASLA